MKCTSTDISITVTVYLCISTAKIFKIKHARISKSMVNQNIIVSHLLFHHRTHTAYLYNGCLAWYNVLTTLQVHSHHDFEVPESATNKRDHCGLVR